MSASRCTAGIAAAAFFSCARQFQSCGAAAESRRSAWCIRAARAARARTASMVARTCGSTSSADRARSTGARTPRENRRPRCNTRMLTAVMISLHRARQAINQALHGGVFHLHDALLATSQALMSAMLDPTSPLAFRVLPVPTRSTMLSDSPTSGASSIEP